MTEMGLSWVEPPDVDGDIDTPEELDMIGGWIRRVASQLAAMIPSMMKVSQAVVTDLDLDNLTVTVKPDGLEQEIPGFSYLLDGYRPVIGDVVWVLDCGPSSKFVLGVTATLVERPGVGAGQIIHFMTLDEFLAITPTPGELYAITDLS